MEGDFLYKIALHAMSQFIMAFRAHCLALVEASSFSTAEVDLPASTNPSSPSSPNNCDKCKEDVNLRLSVLMKSADEVSMLLAQYELDHYA